MPKAGEPVFVQAFISETSVERLNISILVRLSGLNQEQLHAALMRPGEHRPTTELFAIVRANGLRQAPVDNDPV